MTSVIPERMTVDLSQHDRDHIVVFLIGMRVRAWWKLWHWVPVARAMGRILRELSSQPDSGLLGFMGRSPGLFVQYWSSFEDLNAYASDQRGEHYPAWADFNRRLLKSGEVGIWHETYVVPTSQVECVYHHMPPLGLGTFMPLVPATGSRQRAATRYGHT